MRLVVAARAATILYNLLCVQPRRKTFILPANICPIVPLTFCKAQVPFEFIDISPDSLCLDAAQTLMRLKKNLSSYGGILFAHTYGTESSFETFFSKIKQMAPQLLLIDDCCLCAPRFEPPQATSADVVLFSTGYAKIAELGYGGYAFLRESVPYAEHLLTYDATALDNVTAAYKHAIAHGTRFEYTDSAWLDTTKPTVSLQTYQTQVEQTRAAALAQRAKLNAVYTRHLPAAIQLPSEFQTWRFQIRVPQRERLLRAIFDAGYFASAHYASLAGIFTASDDAPNSRALAAHVLNLFNDHHFDSARARAVSDIVNAHLSRCGVEIG
jgi:dTDP-4-amino-4,6-dideoxygalactose transaminase